MDCFKIDYKNIGNFKYFINKLKENELISETQYNHIMAKITNMKEFIVAYIIKDWKFKINHIAPPIFLINKMYKETNFLSKEEIDDAIKKYERLSK